MDTQLLPYRLKSARRKKRLQKKDRDKQLLKLEKEREAIWKDPEYLTTVTLEQPYQKGWKRLFVLRENFKKYRPEFYQQMLDPINTIQYHYDKSFKKPKRKTNRHKYSHDLPELRTISRYNWYMNKMKFTEEQRNYFEKIKFWDDYRYEWTYKFAFKDPHYYFHITMVPDMITTIKQRDIEKEKRLNFIDDYLQMNGRRYRLVKVRGGYTKYWYGKTRQEKDKYANPFKNKPIRMWEDDTD